MLDKFNKRNATPEKGVPAAIRETRIEQPAPAAPAQPKRQAKASIGPGLHVSGDVAGKADLTVEGTMEGTIHLPGNVVTIAPSGEVKAKITAASVMVDGRVMGDIVGIEQVVLSKTAVVRGNIIAPRVNLEGGSKFKGSIDMDPNEEKVGPNAAPRTNKPAQATDAPVKPASSAPPATATAKESAGRH